MLDMDKGVTVAALAKVVPEFKSIADNPTLENRLLIESIYEHAINEQASEVAELQMGESLVIPRDVDYTSNQLSLGNEDREKLIAVKPATVCI